MHRQSTTPLTPDYLRSVGQFDPREKRPKGTPVEPVLPRLMANIEINEFGCWLWIGRRMATGYGSISVAGKSELVHRCSYVLLVGHLGDLDACHSCDVHYAPGDMTYRRCINPQHLYAATNAENHGHSKASGRVARGPRQNAVKGVDCHSAKLTPDIVRDIRREYASIGTGQAELGARYGVSAVAISKIVLRKTWKHVD